MMRKIIIALLLLSAGFAQAQKLWTLQECVDYALDKNVNLRQQSLGVDYQKNELKQSKYNRLPTAELSVSQGYNFGRSLDRTDSYVDASVLTTNVGVGGRMLLWNGGRLGNTTKQREFQLKRSLETFEKAKEDLKVNIAVAYLDVLQSKETLVVMQKQLEQSNIQIKRTQKLVEAGKLAEGVLLEIKAQSAREMLNVVEAENNHKFMLLTLAQMLALDNYEGFDIVIPELPVMQAEFSVVSSNKVFGDALQYRPEIKIAEYDVASSEMELEISRAGYMPSVSLSAGLNERYFNTINQPDLSFSDQIEQYDGGVSLGVSLPLFSKMQNKTNVKNAQLQVAEKKLALEASKLELRKLIEQSYLSALAAFERFQANTVAEASMQESFRYMEKKFELGRVSTVEYSEAKTNLAKAQSDLIQAKYVFIFRSKILDFYRGVDIQL